jgi:hypothetical protein
VAGNGLPKPPRWARYQIGLGVLYLNLGIGLLVLQSVDMPLLGATLDFGWLPPTLMTIGVYVTFGPILVEILASVIGRGRRDE